MKITIIALLSLLPVLIFVLYAGTRLWSSQNWVQAPGKILSYDITIVDTYKRYGDVGARQEYKLNVTYEYTFENISHTSSTVTAGLPTYFGSTTQAENFLSNLQAQTPLMVYVSPKNPKQAALQVLPKLTFGQILILASFLSFGVSIVVLGFRFMKAF